MGEIDRTVLYIGAEDSLVRRAVSSFDGRATVESVPAVSAATDVLDGSIACVVVEQDLFEDADSETLSIRDGSDPPVIVLTRGQQPATELLERGVADIVDRERPAAETVLARRLGHLLPGHRGHEALAATVGEPDAGTGSDSQHERLVDTLLGALDDAFYMLDPSGDLIRWNDRFVELSGYSEAAVQDMTATDFFDSEDEQRVLEAIERVRQQESVRIEVEMRTADGGSVPIEFSGAPLTDEAGNVRAILGTGRDMTGKQDRVQELRRYETILNVLGDPVYAVDDEGRYTYVNDAFVEHTGYDRSEAIGSHVSKVTPEEIERGQEIIQRLISKEDLQSITWEMNRISADGERIPTENHTALLPPDDGEFQGSVGVIRDISERKERERQIKRQRDRLESVLDAAPYPFAHVSFEDGEPTVLQVNDAFETVFGFEEETLVGDSLDDYITPDEQRDAAGEINERAREGEPTSMEVTRRTADGERREFLFKSASLAREDGTVEGLGAYIDITEQKRRIELLHQLRQNVTDVVWMTDPKKGSMEFISDAYEAVWGRSTESLREQPTSFVDAIHPEDRERVREALETQRTDPERYGETYRVEQPDGEIRWVRDRASGVYEDGELKRIVGVATDITERKKRERELRLKTRAIEEAPVGVTISDPDREDNPLIYANKHFQQLTGYPEDKILGDNCRYLQGAETDPELVAELREAIDEAHPVTVELRNYRKDGTEFWNRVTVAPVRDDAGEVTNFVGFQADITERKEREQELTLKNRAMDEAPIGITIHDATRPGCPITYANSGFEAVTGYEPGAVEGASLSMLSGAETDESTLAALNAAFDEEHPASLVLLLYHEDGSPFWARVSLTPVSNEDGVMTHFVGSLQDVTTIKEHEQQVARRLEEFGDLLAEDLQVPVQEARSTLASVDSDGDTAAVEQAAHSLERIESLIEGLTTVHARAVTSREVGDEMNAIGGPADDGEQ